jgi:3-deoxy-D-manno-octulosonate 8-phosphate phosphatase (KDO 8-P phosphatase)
LVSGESGPLLDAIAAKLGVTEVYPDCKDKASALRAFAERNGLELGEICYIGDDVNDVPALEISGLAVAPASAHRAASSVASVVTVRPGGAGSVREVIDTLLAK